MLPRKRSTPLALPAVEATDLTTEAYQGTIELDEGPWDMFYLIDPIRTALVRPIPHGHQMLTQLPGHLPPETVRFYTQKAPMSGEEIH